MTFCAFARHRAFTTAAIVDLVLHELLRACAREGFEIVAYCFMPDHAHLLVGGTRPDSDLVRWITISKQFAAVAYRRSTGRKLWQEGWYDRVVRESDDVAEVIRYLIENPIRGLLVDDIGHYPFWGSSICSREDLLAILDRRT